MTKRSVIAGKVMHTPDYDVRRVPAEPDAVVGAAARSDASASFKVGLYSDGGRTWARDKALLVALGVDGDVPLAVARVNAGLDGKRKWLHETPCGQKIMVPFAVLMSAANDNELAVKAA